jgi:hypothetical protein
VWLDSPVLKIIHEPGNGTRKLILEHVRRYNEELIAAGIDNDCTVPMIPPGCLFNVE